MDTIGVQAVYQDAGFNSGMTKYNSALGTANKTSEQFSKQAKTTGASVISLNQAVQLGTQVLQYAKQAYDATIGATVAYADQVRALMNLTGMSAEESSKLIQITDDIGISYQTLSTALEAAVRKGVDPSVESIAKLSDEYLKLEPGLQRSKFLMDNFGKSGVDMAEIMKKGGAAIREMGDAVDGSMVLTQDNVDAAKQWAMTLDELEDRLAGVGYAIGNALIPVLIDAYDAFDNLANFFPTLYKAFDEQNRKAMDGAASYDDYVAAIKPVVEQMNTIPMVSAHVSTALDYQKYKNDQLTGSLETGQIVIDANADAINGLTLAYGQSSLAGINMNNLVDNMNQSIAEQSAVTNEDALTILNWQKAVASATKTSTSYYDSLHYTDAVMKKMVQAGLAGELGKQFKEYGDTMPDLVEEHDKLQKQYDGLIKYAPEVAAKIADIKKEMETAGKKEKGALAKQLKDLEKSAGGAAGNIQNLSDKLADNEQKQLDLKNATLDTIKSFLWQQAAAGLDGSAQLELAKAMGLIDDTSYEAAKKMADLNAEYGKSGNLNGYIGSVIDLLNYLAELNGMDVSYSVTTTYYTQNVGSSAYQPGTQHEMDKEYQPKKTNKKSASGTDFIVPPGYLNDSYIMGVQSGERVIVIPSNSVSTTNNYYNTSSPSYNLGIQTSQSAAMLQRSFNQMRLWS